MSVVRLHHMHTMQRCGLLLVMFRGLCVCVCVCVCMCVLVTTVSCDKTAESMKMPCGLWTWVVPRNHVSCVGP